MICGAHVKVSLSCKRKYHVRGQRTATVTQRSTLFIDHHKLFMAIHSYISCCMQSFTKLSDLLQRSAVCRDRQYNALCVRVRAERTSLACVCVAVTRGEAAGGVCATGSRFNSPANPSAAAGRRSKSPTYGS